MKKVRNAAQLSVDLAVGFVVVMVIANYVFWLAVTEIVAAVVRNRWAIVQKADHAMDVATAVVAVAILALFADGMINGENSLFARLLTSDLDVVPVTAVAVAEGYYYAPSYSVPIPDSYRSAKNLYEKWELEWGWEAPKPSQPEVSAEPKSTTSGADDDFLILNVSVPCWNGHQGWAVYKAIYGAKAETRGLVSVWDTFVCVNGRAPLESEVEEVLRLSAFESPYFVPEYGGLVIPIRPEPAIYKVGMG